MDKEVNKKQVTGSERTREKILSTAEELFAGKGFGQTSIRDITTGAGVNLASVNYHFGSKQDLYVQVFRRRLGFIREERLHRFRELISSGKGTRDLEGVLRAFTRSFLDPLLTDVQGRKFLRLLRWELVEGRLPRELFLNEMVRPIAGVLESAINGVYPGLNSLDLRMCIHSIAGQLIHLLLQFMGTVGHSNRVDLLKDYGIYIDHVVKFSCAGIRSYRGRTGSG